MKPALVWLVLGLGWFHALAGEPGGTANPKEATTQDDSDWVDDRWSKTEIGPFLGATIQTPRQSTPKALAIRVGESGESTVCFDTDLLRYSAAWTGGFLKLHPQRYGLISAPSPGGAIQFSSAPLPGCGASGNFEDPRPLKLGPLPSDWGRYKGIYQCGNEVALCYSVGTTTLFETPGFHNTDGNPVFTRTIETQGEHAITLRLCDEPGWQSREAEIDGKHYAVLELNGERIIATSGGSEAKVASRGDTLFLQIPPGAQLLQVAICRTRQPLEEAVKWLGVSSEIRSPQTLAKGGPSKWRELTTRGVKGKNSGPFAIDTLTLPYDNPWNALFFTSGHDFLKNGDAVLATIHGDVWLVSGIDEGLQNLKWKRFATGLYQPLGVKVLDGKIYVLERDQITILHDLNGDREADFYENFNNECISAGGGHSYATCLETDSEGNFYFLKCAEGTPHGGTVLKVPSSGKGLEVVATGFRNPNGMGIGPGDIITVADQQGEWVPETRLDVIRRGEFHGYMPMHKRSEAPTDYTPPLCWIPRAVDNSAGGQVWIPSGEWGPFGGQMIHLSYGRCEMMLAMRDATGKFNGAVTPLPGRFLSGVMRGRFNPRDKALYLSGLRGWQTAAIKDGCLQRVRFTGAPVNNPMGFAVMDSHRIRLDFAEPLNKEIAEDLSSYTGEQWNYKWTAAYGSPDFSVEHPEKQGRDKLPPAKASLVNKGRSVILEFEHLQPVHTLRLKCNLETERGEEYRGEVYITINELQGTK